MKTDAVSTSGEFELQANPTILFLKDLLSVVMLHGCRHKRLKEMLCSRLRAESLRFVPEFSGRVAIFKLGRHLIESSGKTVAYVPDFICNVVHIALETAGYSVRTYKTDRLFEPDLTEIETIFANEDAGILVTANIFGSSAFLDGLRSPLVRKKVLSGSAHIIVDLCQDISLVSEIPRGYGTKLSAVVSFNDKSFPGAMGGGILTELNVWETQETLRLREQLLLYSLFLRKVIAETWLGSIGESSVMKRLDSVRSNPGRQSKTGFAHSRCAVFPYQIAPRALTRLQIILALVGLKNLPRYVLRKQETIVSLPAPLRTRYYATAPYLALESTAVPGHIGNARKRPYAIQGRPDVSVLPDLTIIHNKGFFDYGE